MTDEPGPLEIVVRPFPGPCGKWQVSTRGGTEPAWAPDGRTISYREDTRFMAVSLDGETGPAIGRPASLFDRPVIQTGNSRSCDVAHDGKSFISIEDDSDAGTIDLILNWSTELLRQPS